MTAQTLEIDGKQYVLIERAEYDRLLGDASGVHEDDLPPLPEPDADGNYPAVAYSRASIARKIILMRRKARLTQAELAERAGVRLETISRLENARHSPDPSTVDKIDKALKSVEQKNRRRTTRRRG